MNKRNLYSLIFVVFSLPANLLAARLELRHADTGATEASILVGEEIEVEVWIDSESESLSGAAIFLSFDETRFELVENDRAEVAGFQPFAPGAFLANGEIYRNYMLAEDDPAASAPGIQLDYSIVRAEDQGKGPVASFRLRTLAPIREGAILIDESGVRETRFFLPDGGQRSFRFITPLKLTVQGIAINGLPDQLVLPRGSSQALRLDDLVFDPIYGDADLTWTISEAPSLIPTREGNELLLQAPTDTSPWERLVLTVENPDGQSASDTVDIFVNAPPVLSELAPLVFAEDESYEIPLDALVDDPDTQADLLTWSVSSSPEIQADIAGPPYTAHLSALPEWHGQGLIELVVTDNHAFADTLQVTIEVAAVNDAPRLLASPNVRLTKGKQDSSLAIVDLVADIEDATELLGFSWSGNEHVGLALSDGRLLLDAPADWEGIEEIILVFEDSGGLTAAGPLTVTIVPSLPPTIVNPPQSLGLIAGDNHLLALDDVAVDPDDPSEDLVWTVNGQDRLNIQLSGGRLVRIEAPADFVGIETLTLTVTDPSGGNTSFDLTVFAASPDGGPLLAALPEISIPMAGVDTSIDLDDFVFDLDHASNELSFFLPERDDIELRVDPLTHVLIIEPGTAAQPGQLELEVRVIDPDGNEAVAILRLELIGEKTEAGLSFAFNAIPDFTLVSGQIHSFGLDSFVTGDYAPDTVAWQVSGQQNLMVVIDPVTRQVSVRSSGGWTGSEEITIVAEVPDLPAQTRTVRITIIADPDAAPTNETETPELAALPALQLADGAFDQSLDLDAFLTGAVAADITWALSGGEHVRALVDEETHRLLIFTDEGFSGEEMLTLLGTLADGTQLEAVLRVEVQAATLVFALTARTEVPLFAGATALSLPLDQLIEGEVDPDLLLWVAKGLQPVSVAYDSLRQNLILTPNTPWQASDIIELTAVDPQGNEYSGLVLAQIFPTDGSLGLESEDFQLVLLPNPLQPAYVDLYIISQLGTEEVPMLRLSDGGWTDLALAEHSTGIWQANHTFAANQQGQYEFIALSIAADKQLFKSAQTLNLNAATSAKIVTAQTGGYGWPKDR